MAFATLSWIGGAMAVRQVARATLTLADAADTLTLTVSDKVVTYTCTTGVEADEVSAFADAIAASAELEFKDLELTVNGAELILTGPLDGTPFTASFGGTGVTWTPGTAVSPTGPNWWTDASNWREGAVPAASDHVVIDRTSYPIKYGIGSGSGISLTSLKIGPDFTGTIGLPDMNEAGYVEYRDRFLVAAVATLEFDGEQCGGCRINTGAATAAAVTVLRTGQGTFDPAFELLGSNAGNSLNVVSGQVGVCLQPNTTANWPTVRVGSLGDNLTDPPTVIVGPGCTPATVTVNGGTLELRDSITTGSVRGGTVNFVRAAAAGTLTLDGGTTNWRSSGGITTALSVGGGATFDGRFHPAPKSIAAMTVYGGSKSFVPKSVWTFTTGINVIRCGLPTEGGQENVAVVDLGEHVTLTVAAGP